MNGAPYLNSAGVYLIQTLFSLYILALMLRFLLQWVRADFYNPLVQFLVTITNPPLMPLRRFVPGLMGLDMAAVLLMLVLTMVQWLLILSIGGRESSLLGLLVFAVAELLRLLFNVFFWAVIIRAVLSWVGPDPRQPAVSLLVQLTEPVMRPAREVIPAISGLDLSPIAVILGLQLLQMLLVAPLHDLALGLM